MTQTPSLGSPGRPDAPVAVARPVTDGDDEVNPYLLGVYAPVQDEITAENLEVIGEIPADLNGVYLRNGPNRRYAADGRYHWFDGDGMIHALHLEGGKARYRNRWVRTEAFQAEDKAHAPLWSGVMEDPKGNPFGNHHGLGLKDSANTDVIFHRGQVLATWYMCGSPYAVDPLSLETLGAEDFLGTLVGDVMAHPKVDETTGELFWFDYGPQPPYLRYGVVGADGRVSHTTDVPLPGPRLPHDMAITETHAVLMDLPLVQDEAARRAGRWKIAFDRSLPSRFAVLPRYGEGTQARWFEARPGYIYHVVNAYDDGDAVVMDVCRVRQPQHDVVHTSKLAAMLSYLRLDARLWRYRFDLRTGQTTEGPLDEDNTEFPSIDTRTVGRRNRYTYNTHISPRPESLLFDGIVRYDLHDGSSQKVLFGDGRWGSEAPFAPRDGSTGDDDGYVVSFVTDEREGRSEVAIFDASDLPAGPVGRVLLPQRVPLGFHATWVRSDQLRSTPLARA